MDLFHRVTKKNQQGQSVIETLVGFSVLLLLITGFVFGITYSLKKSQFSKLSVQATKYAQEGMEKARNERDRTPDVFWGQSGTTEETLGGFTRRTIYEEEEENTKMKVTVIVQFTDQTGTHQSKLSTYLTKW